MKTGYPFEEYAWDDDPGNDHSWVDGMEAKSAYDELKVVLKEILEAESEINRREHNERIIVKDLKKNAAYYAAESVLHRHAEKGK